MAKKGGAEKLSIELKKFSERTQAVRYTPEGKENVTLSVGIMEPGEVHDFGAVKRPEKIEVIHGAIFINEYQIAHLNTSAAYNVKSGTRVILRAYGKGPCAYKCTFPDETE